MKKKISAECCACKGTGLYQGTFEKEYEAVVCLKCNGTGKVIIEYTPFTKRKERENISKVFLSEGMYVGTDFGPGGNGISYEDFKQGKMPRKDLT